MAGATSTEGVRRWFRGRSRGCPRCCRCGHARGLGPGCGRGCGRGQRRGFGRWCPGTLTAKPMTSVGAGSGAACRGLTATASYDVSRWAARMAGRQVSRVCLYPCPLYTRSHYSSFFSRDRRRGHWPAARSGVKASRAIEDTKRRTQRCPSSPSSDMVGRVVPPSASHCSHEMRPSRLHYARRYTNGLADSSKTRVLGGRDN